MPTHKSKKNNKNTRNNIHKKFKSKKKYVGGEISFTKKTTAVDIIKLLSIYESILSDDVIIPYYRLEFWVSDEFLNNTFKPQRESKNIITLDKISAFKPSVISAESKTMKLIYIFDILEDKKEQDMLKEYSIFSNKIFEILNMMDRSNYSIYGDALLICGHSTARGSSNV